MNNLEMGLLPYPKDALEPHLTAETLETHYEKHHRGYFRKLAQLVEDTPEADAGLEELVRTASGAIFRNAAQVWNHDDFYWRSLSPRGGGRPGDALLHEIERAFGSFDRFRGACLAAAKDRFGSGWCWLVREPGGARAVRSTPNADNPVQEALVPLLTLDVWEHAYYLDYRNERARYVEVFLEHPVDWQFVASNLEPSVAEPGC